MLLQIILIMEILQVFTLVQVVLWMNLLRNPSCDEVGYNEDGSWDHDAYWECQPEEYRNSNVQILGIFSFGIAA